MSYHVASQDEFASCLCSGADARRLCPFLSIHSPLKRNGTVLHAWRDECGTGISFRSRDRPLKCVHLEEDILIFLASLSLDLLGELDDGLEMRIVLLVLCKILVRYSSCAR